MSCFLDDWCTACLLWWTAELWQTRHFSTGTLKRVLSYLITRGVCLSNTNQQDFYQRCKLRYEMLPSGMKNKHLINVTDDTSDKTGSNGAKGPEGTFTQLLTRKANQQTLVGLPVHPQHTPWPRIASRGTRSGGGRPCHTVQSHANTNTRVNSFKTRSAAAQGHSSSRVTLQSKYDWYAKDYMCYIFRP